MSKIMKIEESIKHNQKNSILAKIGHMNGAKEIRIVYTKSFDSSLKEWCFGMTANTYKILKFLCQNEMPLNSRWFH